MAESSSGSSGSASTPLPDLGPDAVVSGGQGGNRRGAREVPDLSRRRDLPELGSDRPVTDLSPLASLRIVDGSLEGPGFNTNLETLEGLEQLKSVGEFTFSRDGLRGMSGVRNLREVKGSFKLFSIANLTDLDGLENLQFTGRLDVTFNAVLVDIDGLSGLRRVDGDLRIEANPELTGIDGLMALEHVTDDLYIRENPKVPTSEIDALLSRVTVDGEIDALLSRVTVDGEIRVY